MSSFTDECAAAMGDVIGALGTGSGTVTISVFGEAYNTSTMAAGSAQALLSLSAVRVGPRSVGRGGGQEQVCTYLVRDADLNGETPARGWIIGDADFGDFTVSAVERNQGDAWKLTATRKQ